MARPAIHPGEILADELTELKITPTELSRQISVQLGACRLFRRRANLSKNKD
jgi:plasmid maintenance system antidote protein VapI